MFNSGGLTCYYHINTAAATVAVTLVTMTMGTFTSSGFVEMDPTNMPGMYQLCVPNAAYVSGQSVTIFLQGAANMAQTPIEIEITRTNNQDVVRGGITALPAAVPGAAGGVFIAGSNAATTVNITGTLSGSVGSVAGNITGNLLGTLTTTERNAIADANLNRDMALVTVTNARSPINALRFLRNAWTAGATTLTVYKEDDTTTAWTSVLTLNAGAIAITGSDPS